MKGTYLGEVASLVLTVIGIVEKTNAVEIQEIISTILNKPMHIGGLYNALKQLENDGLIETEKERIERVDHRIRNAYTLSAKGRKQFQHEQKVRLRLSEYAKTIYNKDIY